MLVAVLSLLLGACAGSDSVDSGADAATCGDLDGPAGADTGNVPAVNGSWTSTFAQNYYDDDCTAANLSATSEAWIGAFEVLGTPDALYVYFGSADRPTTERLWGAMDPYGGITFTGQKDHPAGTLHVQFGGLVYDDPNRGRPTIRGSAFLGLDADDDGDIDCSARGSWTAFKSG